MALFVASVNRCGEIVNISKVTLVATCALNARSTVNVPVPAAKLDIRLNWPDEPPDVRSSHLSRYSSTCLLPLRSDDTTVVPSAAPALVVVANSRSAPASSLRTFALVALA